MTREIRWLDIADFFPAGTVDPKEFVLQCKNGDEFYLSKDLADYAILFELVTRRMDPPEIAYDLNYRPPDAYFDTCETAAFVSLAVGLWTFGQWLFAPGHLGVNDLENMVALIVLILFYGLSSAWCWLNLRKFPRLIRAGGLGLCIRMGTRNNIVSWDRITEIRKIGGWLIVDSRAGWFVMLASKTEPMTEKLLEYNKKVLMLKGSRQ